MDWEFKGLFGPDGLWRSPEHYAEDVTRLTDTGRVEIIDDRAVEWPNRSLRDGAIAFGVSFHIDTYLQDHPRGRSFRPAPGFILRTGPRRLIRIPDVAYLELHRVAELKFVGVCPVVPDLIVEVITEQERSAEVEARIRDFLSAGTSMAWLVDARTKTCTVRRRKGADRTFGLNDKLYAAPILPRLNLRVYELFGE